MDAAAVMLVASLLSGEPEAVKCMAVSKGEVWTIPNAYDAGTCLGLAIVACTRDVNTRVRYHPEGNGTTTVYPPFRRCEARPYPGIEAQVQRVVGIEGGAD